MAGRRREDAEPPAPAAPKKNAPIIAYGAPTHQEDNVFTLQIDIREGTSISVETVPLGPDHGYVTIELTLDAHPMGSVSFRGRHEQIKDFLARAHEAVSRMGPHMGSFRRL